MRINAAGTTITLPNDPAIWNGTSIDFVCLNGADATFVLGAGATWDVTPPSTVVKAGGFVTATKNASKWSLEGDVNNVATAIGYAGSPALGATTVEGAIDTLAQTAADHDNAIGTVVAHLTDTVDTDDASAISILDTANNFGGVHVEDALLELANYSTGHVGATTDAHDVSAISIVDAGGFYGPTNVEGALADAGSFIVNHVSDDTAAHERRLSHLPTRAMIIVPPLPTSRLHWQRRRPGRPRLSRLLTTILSRPPPMMRQLSRSYRPALLLLPMCRLQSLKLQPKPRVVRPVPTRSITRCSRTWLSPRSKAAWSERDRRPHRPDCRTGPGDTRVYSRPHHHL